MADVYDLTPIDSTCLRCGADEQMRVPGLCQGCRDELSAKFRGEARDVDAGRYEPAMHVTPNAVALKDD